VVVEVQVADVVARTERLPVPVEDDDTNLSVLVGRGQRVLEFVPRLLGQTVEPVRPVERDVRYVTVRLLNQVIVGHSPACWTNIHIKIR